MRLEHLSKRRVNAHVTRQVENKWVLSDVFLGEESVPHESKGKPEIFQGKELWLL